MDGSQNDKREFLFIDDLIKILLAIMNKKISSGIYNVGTSQQIYIKNIIKYVQKKLKSNCSVIFLKKKNSPNFSILSTEKIKKIIKYKIKNNFYDNLNKTVEYFEGICKKFD
jgi:nucleoside-diphosphate-sugar epimerase